MPEDDHERQDPHEIQRRARNRRAEFLPDYALLSRQDVEQISSDIVHRATAKYLTEVEIIRLIDQRSAARWHSVGLTVSADSSQPGDPETSLRKIFDWNRDQYAVWLASKGQFFKIAVVTGQIGTAMVVIIGGLWALFTLVIAHLK